MLAISGFSLFHATGMLFATGSPHDGVDCNSCHSGGASAPTFSISATPAFGTGNTYSPNTSYTISVNCTGIYPKYGFDLEILDALSLGAGDAGTFNSALMNCQIVPTSKNATNVTHLAPTGNNDSATFQFSWTSPAGGNSFLYCAVNGTNFDGTTSGDLAAITNITLSSIFSGISFNEQNKSAIQIFPNPSNGKFMVEAKEAPIPIEMNIYNAMGENVFENKMISEKSEINLSDKPKGVYFIHLKSGNAIMNKKIVIGE